MNHLFWAIKKLIFKDKCISCGKKLNDKSSFLCYNCRKDFERISSLKKDNDIYYIWRYEGIFKKLIFSYKFKNVKDISKFLGEIIRPYVYEIIKMEDIDYIVPIPINKNRRLERGFNQVEEILEYLEIPYLKSLRVKNTKKMYKISNEKERQKNIKNSFYINQNLEDKNILILDDIYTSGATIEEFKKILKENKASKIKTLVLSRGLSSLKNKKLY